MGKGKGKKIFFVYFARDHQGNVDVCSRKPKHHGEKGTHEVCAVPPPIWQFVFIWSLSGEDPALPKSLSGKGKRQVENIS